MKESVSHQAEVVIDATWTLGKGLRKSFKKCGKEAKHLVRSFSDFIDVEDRAKSIHKVAHPEEHSQKTSIVHTPIDWSKQPSSAFNKGSENVSATVEEEHAGNDMDDIETQTISSTEAWKPIKKPKISVNKTTKEKQFHRCKDNDVKIRHHSHSAKGYKDYQ